MFDHTLYFLTGFVAQLIDGALGMGYGVTATSVLLGTGMTPVAASASVHVSKVFTGGMSAFWHFKFGNVNRTLFFQLVVPGAIGGVIGAYLLTELPRQDLVKPVVAAYLTVLGIRILLRGLRREVRIARVQRVFPLGIVGGFLDSIGGGGWGPLVTATLFVRGIAPNVAIGTVNSAEFFVSILQAATFISVLGTVHLGPTLAMILGAAFSAPLAAYACRRVATNHATVLVGALCTLLSLRTLVRSVMPLLSL